MSAARLTATRRSESGAESVCAEPSVTLRRAAPTPSSVKRSVLAMSMRFSYDAITDWTVIC
jgi:hypothetical protein